MAAAAAAAADQPLDTVRPSFREGCEERAESESDDVEGMALDGERLDAEKEEESVKDKRKGIRKKGN